jgi:hypothetical protein
MIGYYVTNVSVQFAVSFFKVVKGESENSLRQKTAVNIDNSLKTSNASKVIDFSLHHTSLHTLPGVQ